MQHQDWYLRTVYHYAINYWAQIANHSNPHVFTCTTPWMRPHTYTLTTEF
jgi:hypothetical protein